MNRSSRKMEGNLTGMWVSFFTAAGIPSDVSATYALTFTENRIQDDMLLDLNKEYLRDMGISRMGDVIAILRHAKQVHENAARDRVLNTTSSNVIVPVAAVAGRLTNTNITQNKSSSPASRILEHYTRNAPVPEAPAQVTVNRVQLKRKIDDTGVETSNIKKIRSIRFGAAQKAAEEIPAPATKTTVFSRLGNNEPKNTITFSTQSKQHVSLNTVAGKQIFSRLGNNEPKKTITFSTQFKQNPSPATVAGKQIFSRLGAKTAVPVPTVIEKPVPIVPLDKDALKYEGILKAAPKTGMTVTATKNNRKIAVGTMRADETPKSIEQKLAVPVTVKKVVEKVSPKTKSVKFSSTVQYKEIESVKPATHIFNKPERRLSMAEVQESGGIKARLGAKNTHTNLTITKNVFNRLGM